MPVTSHDVESWLDGHQDWLTDYFLKKADMCLINKWMVVHGYHPLQDYITGRRGSLSQESSGQTSPDNRAPREGFIFTENELKPQRTNSKKYLRHDFAKSRMRSIFRTHEPSVSADSASLAERRSSLKGMRQFLSLPPTSGNMLSVLIQSKVRLPRVASKDDELKRELRHINERDFFLEIVKDISHDLDLRSLTSQIVNNICILLDAQRSSLFFVEGAKGKQTLVSKVFDVCTGTNCIPTSRGDNIVRIPWGQGIIGFVASTGDTVNITHASQDPRYRDDVDRVAGYTSTSLLCMAIRNADAEVIAVVQVVNKTESSVFNTDDEKLLETYLAFCGMAISNAQAIESYTREYDRNKVLLEVVHELFEEQTSVENVVMKIMQRAQSLLRCERCVVMLKDSSDVKMEGGKFGRVFDLNPVRNGQSKSRNSKGGPDVNHPNKIAEIVASTGETVNIADGQIHAWFDMPREASPSRQTKSILCKPIRNNNFQTIGVAQLINKTDGAPFDDNDDQLFEAFAIFCGLGINNCMLYDEVTRSAAKQAVALEVLSYHASVTVEDLHNIKRKRVPEGDEWNLTKLTFNDFSLNTDEMVLAGIHIFKDSGLLKTFKIDSDTLARWLLTVRKNYRNVAYHNWRHAFNVCQFMYSLLNTCNFKRHLTDLECLAMIVACLCHDLDHRGTNNAFQKKSSSALSQLYGTQATLEHHHFNHAVIILNSEGHNIFSTLSSEDYGRVMKILKHAILATDLSLHIQVRQKFVPLVESGLYNWEDSEQREILRSTLMTTCDIASITKPWHVQRRAADLVMTEFFDQGDKERAVLKIQPQAYMDRERQDELPRLQMEWIDGICHPLYKSLMKLDPTLDSLLERVMDNRSHWVKLDDERLAKMSMKGLKETAC